MPPCLCELSWSMGVCKFARSALFEARLLRSARISPERRYQGPGSLPLLVNVGIAGALAVGWEVAEPRLDLIHRSYDRPIATMARGIVAAQFRRVEPRGHASIEKKSIVAAEAIAKETGKLVKVHPSLGNDKVYLGRARHADAIPRLAIG